MAEKAEAEHFIWFCSWFISTRLSYAAYLLTGFNVYVCVFFFLFFFPPVSTWVSQGPAMGCVKTT